jgi:hypothetical protein
MKNIDKFFFFNKEHVEPCCVVLCRTMQARKTCARRQEKHVSDRVFIVSGWLLVGGGTKGPQQVMAAEHYKDAMNSDHKLSLATKSRQFGRSDHTPTHKSTSLDR